MQGRVQCRVWPFSVDQQGWANLGKGWQMYPSFLNKLDGNIWSGGGGRRKGCGCTCVSAAKHEHRGSWVKVGLVEGSKIISGTANHLNSQERGIMAVAALSMQLDKQWSGAGTIPESPESSQHIRLPD